MARRELLVVHGVNGVRTLLACVIKDVPLAFSPGLGKISCSKQKWKNSPEELGKECVAGATGFFFPVCGSVGAERDETPFKN